MSTDERRRAILEGAAKLLAQYGHAKTTMADIAREAGIGVGSLYLEFASKDAIVAALSLDLHDRVLAAMRLAVREHAAGALADQLVAVLDVRSATYLALARRGAHACELVHCSSHPVKDANARFTAEEQRLFSEMLASARARGELAAELDAIATAALVQRAIATISPPHVFQHAEDDLRRVAREMASLLLFGLLRRADAPEPKRAKPRRGR